MNDQSQTQTIIVASPAEMAAWNFLQAHPNVMITGYVVFGIFFVLVFAFICKTFISVNRADRSLRKSFKRNW